MNNINNSFAFFGSSRLSVIVLDELAKLGLLPKFIVTTPDRPVGRKQIVTPNVVKVWASEHKITCYDPEKLDADFIAKIREENTKTGVGNSMSEKNSQEICPVFLVASFGRILPKSLIDIPSKKTLNIHPSLLPKYRGASPLPTAILEDTKDTGVSIMVLDEEMDHGPIVAQKNITIETWPNYLDYEEMMARSGAQLFSEILPRWMKEEIQAQEQDHSRASYTKKFSKEDTFLDLTADPYTNWRKIQAFYGWIGSYFVSDYKGKQIRVKVTEAKFVNNKLEIIKVVPEGSREISYADFCQNCNLAK